MWLVRHDPTKDDKPHFQMEINHQLNWEIYFA